MTREKFNGAYPCACGGHFGSVVDTRPTGSVPEDVVIRRRRVCVKCGKRMTTYELPAERYGKMDRDFKKRVAEIMLRVVREVDKEIQQSKPEFPE